MAHQIWVSDIIDPGEQETICGTLVTDAVAYPSTTVDFALNGYVSTAIGSLAGMLVGGQIDIDGFGPGGVAERCAIRGVTGNLTVSSYRTAAQAVAAAAAVPCVFIKTGGTPRRIRLVNTSAGIIYSWVRGMEPASMFRQLADGTAALLTTKGISPQYGGFWVSPTILAASSQFTFEVEV